MPMGGRASCVTSRATVTTRKASRTRSMQNSMYLLDGDVHSKGRGLMIRLGHFSDLHYAGGANFGEVHRCFSFAVDEAIRRGIECAVISGDSTDHALDVHAPAVEALAGNVRRLADHCPVIMLQGTFAHELPGTLNIFRLLGGRYPIFVAARLQQVALLPRWQWQASNGWRFEGVPDGALALFSCVPTVNKAVVAAACGAKPRNSAVSSSPTSAAASVAPH